MVNPAKKPAKLEGQQADASPVIGARNTWGSVAGTPVGRSVVGDLHRRIEQRLNEPAIEKWSPRKTLLFIVVTCGGFWAGILGLVLALT